MFFFPLQDLWPVYPAVGCGGLCLRTECEVWSGVSVASGKSNCEGMSSEYLEVTMDWRWKVGDTPPQGVKRRKSRR